MGARGTTPLLMPSPLQQIYQPREPRNPLHIRLSELTLLAHFITESPKRKKEKRTSYCTLVVSLAACSMPNMEMAECLYSLQRFIARRGRPERIYSDNDSTFTAAAKWIKMVRQDEKLQGYLSRNGITWQFNLSRAPWWGGQFERLIGLVKAALNKAVGNGQLQWKELESVLLSVETTLND